MSLVLVGLSVGGADEEPKTEGWKEAEAGYRFSFPKDHAAHKDYRIEWWYYTGNLRTAEGRRFGYQLTFFRSGVVRRPTNPSRWALRDLHLAHFAISDVETPSFRSFERINRGGVGWAGAEVSSYRVWNENWQATLRGDDHVLEARDGDAAISLKLTPQKRPVVHGENGISQKGESTGNASHYYSLTRLQTSGTLEWKGSTFRVAGLSWMDHEFGTTFLEAGQVGWDWFSVQLEDGRDLMLFQLRRKDGSIDPHSSGTLVERDGAVLPIRPGTFALEPERTWRSPATGAVYPVRWTVSVPGHNLHLEVVEAFPGQELETPRSAGISYWEGSIQVTSLDGTTSDSTVRGRGYLEMTGYAGKSMAEVFR